MPTPALHTFLNDGEHYDALHSGLSDVEFWVRRARQSGGSVLELACGTGRVSLALGEVGVRAMGIDVSEAYLSWAIQKVAGRDLNVTFELADIRHFTLGRIFQLVAFPFRSVSVLLTDEDLHACFACVRRHLNPGGLFIIDAFNRPAIPEVSPPTTLRYQHPDGTTNVEVGHERRFDSAAGIVTNVFTFQGSAPETSTRAELNLRVHTVADLSVGLQANGFQLVDHFGGYDERPYNSASPYQILVAHAV